ncbi:MAG TPA: Fic family protein [Gaiellales bacterium]|nr:Fic family protein [Gaiellales bacterium]
MFSSAEGYDAVSRAARRGELRSLGPGVYTPRTDEDPKRVVQRNLHVIVGRLVPDAVVADRSAYAGGMAQHGQLFIEHPRRSRDLVLAGVTVRPRRGPGHHRGDIPLAPGLWMSATPRALLENMRPSRARRGMRRTLSTEEVELWLDRIVRTQGEDRLRAYRTEAQRIAPELELERELQRLDPLIGATLGTRQISARTPVLRGRQVGSPFDPDRMVLLDDLVQHLDGLAPEDRPYDLADARARFLPFFEAYFSNFIEGTEFTIEEAARIALHNDIPPGRPEDAHDITGTYEIVSDPAEMRRTPGSGDELVELLRERHAILMAGRPTTRPGEFKERESRAGATTFVAPTMVEGTLTEGFARAVGLEDPFARAVFLMFLVSEVHPFDDGNGRIARVTMNAELTAARQARIVIPTGYRDNYLDALRALSRNENPRPIARVLDFAQRYVAEMDWSSVEAATGLLTRTNALRDPAEGDQMGQRLVLPTRAERDDAG